MKKALFTIFAILLLTAAKSQVKTEFIGLVKYTHNVIPKVKDYDVNYDYSGIGKSSDYYFKDANIKWLTYESYFKMDLFIAKENRDYFLTAKSDTVFTLKNTNRDFDVVDYKITAAAPILGHKCNVLELKLKPLDADSPVTFRRYYFSDDFYIDPKKFANCKSSAYDIIYGQMKSIPLKIEFEFENRIVVWEASEVTPMKLDSHFFEIEKNAVIGYW
ncbi:MAG: hypothetical protein PSV16_15365 [Flavobacterium sp.]|nr:hypothetical protein [Flavobacterium sp.]